MTATLDRHRLSLEVLFGFQLISPVLFETPTKPGGGSSESRPWLINSETQTEIGIVLGSSALNERSPTDYYLYKLRVNIIKVDTARSPTAGGSIQSLAYRNRDNSKHAMLEADVSS